MARPTSSAAIGCAALKNPLSAGAPATMAPAPSTLHPSFFLRRTCIPQNYWTPIHVCARTGQRAMLEFLLSRGAVREALNKDTSTAMHLAAGNGNRDCLEALVEAGANLGARDKARMILVSSGLFPLFPCKWHVAQLPVRRLAWAGRYDATPLDGEKRQGGMRALPAWVRRIPCCNKQGAPIPSFLFRSGPRASQRLSERSNADS